MCLASHYNEAGCPPQRVEALAIPQGVQREIQINRINVFLLKELLGKLVSLFGESWVLLRDLGGSEMPDS